MRLFIKNEKKIKVGLKSTKQTLNHEKNFQTGFRLLVNIVIMSISLELIYRFKRLSIHNLALPT